MRFSTVAITVFGAAASASASTLFARQNGYPNCAIPCTMNADFGGCAPTDNHCLCTNQQFVGSTTACVESACSGQDLQDALTFSKDLCLKVGVTLTDSSPASTPASTPASSAAASSTPASSKLATTSGASSKPASASGASSTPTAPATSAPATSTGASAPKPTSGAVSTGANALVGLVAAALVVLAL